MYSYTMTCPMCSAEFAEYRAKPYARDIKFKMCSACKDHPEDDSDTLTHIAKVGIFDSDTNCKGCKFWQRSDDPETERYSNWYRECLKGKVSDIAEVEDTGLVYALDVCDEWEKK